MTSQGQAFPCMVGSRVNFKISLVNGSTKTMGPDPSLSEWAINSIIALFNKSYMDKEQIIIGRDGQLFADYDIKQYCNPHPPIPLSLMESRVKEIADLQDLLARRGVIFLLLITPSKAATYPEYIPSNLCHAGPFTNRAYYDFRFVSRQVPPQLYQWPCHHSSRQSRSRRLLCFARGGIHWNKLGAYFTTSSIDRHTEGFNESKGRQP